MSNVRQEIAEGAARAYFLCAYADYIEREHDDDAEQAEHETEIAGLPRPGGGENWEDYAPPTSPAAWEQGWALIKRIEREQNQPIDKLYAGTLVACAEDGARCNAPKHTPDLYGHYLAMEAMGHGVAWSDDHEDHPFEVPYEGEDFMIVSRDEALAGCVCENCDAPTGGPSNATCGAPECVLEVYGECADLDGEDV